MGTGLVLHKHTLGENTHEQTEVIVLTTSQ